MGVSEVDCSLVWIRLSKEEGMVWGRCLDVRCVKETTGKRGWE